MLDRRKFLEIMAGISAAAALNKSAWAAIPSSAHVAVIGGGFGGVTLAKYLRKAAPNIKVTLITNASVYRACVHSNHVIAGRITIDEITFSYDALRYKHGVTVINEAAVGYDRDTRTIHLENGERLVCDMLAVSPGVDFIWDKTPGYNQQVGETVMPHAYKAGLQTLALRRMLREFPKGGTWVTVVPPGPYRCPPAPYERSSLICAHLQKNDPTAKVVVLDANKTFGMADPFKKGWERLYGLGSSKAMVELYQGDSGGIVTEVRPDSMTVVAGAGAIRGDVVNFIPPQRPADLAFKLGLVDESGWCPVNPKTFQSTKDPNIFVVGDACMANPMPKSGHSTSSQAKVAAQAIADMLSGKEPGMPSMINSCFSFVGDGYAVSIAEVFRVRNGMIEKDESSGPSPITNSPTQPLLEALYFENWHRTFIEDTFQ